MNQDRVFFSVAVGFIGGVALHSFSDVSLSAAYFLSLVSIAILAYFLVGFIFAPDRKGFHGPLVLVSVLILSFSLGLIRYDFSVREGRNPTLLQSIGQNIKATGLVSGEPDKREGSTLLTVQIDRIIFSGGESKVEDKVLLITERYPEFEYGDKILFEGKFQKPEPFNTGGDRLFDYPAYLAKDGIHYTMFRPRIERLETGGGNVVKRNLLLLKSSFLNSAGKYINEPEISLLGGLLVGAKHGLSKEWQEILRNAGIIHIVVLSGYNITIVANSLMSFFWFLTLKYRLIVGVSAITLFAIMTGGSATVVRASIMALLVLLAQATGRTYEITRALMLAGLVMVFHNPQILVFDPSFELSFLATLGLVYLAPIIGKYFNFVPEKNQIKEVVLSTISTQIFVLPLLLFMTGKVSIVSLITNIAVLPLIPVTMLFGFVTGILGYISSLLSFPFSYITHLLLYYELSVASLLGGLPYAAASVPSFGAGAMIVSYMAISIFLILFYKRQKIKI